MYDKIVLSPLQGHRYKIIKKIKYKDVVVPAGYITNGADIPRIFWSIFPPNRSDYLPAVIIHDYLCDMGEYKKADQYFIKTMKDLKIDKNTIFIMGKSVQFYHFIKPIFKKIKVISFLLITTMCLVIGYTLETS